MNRFSLEIMQDLQAIGDAIKRDVEDGGKNNNYMFSENAKAMKTGAVGLIKCGVSGLNGISLDIDKLCKYAGENEEYMEALQEIIDMLGAHGALLTFEVEEVLTPERFEEIGRACRELDLEKIVQKAKDVVTSGFAGDSFIDAANRTGGIPSKTYGEYFLRASIVLGVIEVLPQIMSDIRDENNSIENKTIEDICRSAFEVAYSYFGGMAGSYIGFAIGMALFGPVGAGIGYVIGSIVGSDLGNKFGTYQGEEFAESIIEMRE